MTPEEVIALGNALAQKIGAAVTEHHIAFVLVLNLPQQEGNAVHCVANCTPESVKTILEWCLNDINAGHGEVVTLGRPH